MSKSPMKDAIEWLWMFHKTYRKAREFLAEHAASSRLARNKTLTKDHACYDQVIGVWNERNILLEIVQTVMEAAAPLSNSLYTAEHRTSQRITAVYHILVVVRDQLMAMFPIDQAPGEIQEKKP
jgi:hypothetical protein